MANKGIFNTPLFDPKFREKVSNSLLFYQEPVEVRQKLSHLANLALVRDFHSQKIPEFPLFDSFFQK